MCLLALAWQQHNDYPLAVVANRDEFYQRPTEAAHFWSDHSTIFGGRDLQAGGTWLGISRNGRFAALTNIRSPAQQNPEARSRGELVRDFLLDQDSAISYCDKLLGVAENYNGFNLLTFDGESLVFCNNQAMQIEPLSPGVYGLSNASLDTPWPKTRGATARLRDWLNNPQPVDDLATLLHSRKPADEHELPSTGVSRELEQALSSQFIHMDDYGTRCSTGLLVHRSGHAEMFEQGYDRGTPSQSRYQRIDHFLRWPV